MSGSHRMYNNRSLERMTVQRHLSHLKVDDPFDKPEIVPAHLLLYVNEYLQSLHRIEESRSRTKEATAAVEKKRTPNSSLVRNATIVPEDCAINGLSSDAFESEVSESKDSGPIIDWNELIGSNICIPDDDLNSCGSDDTESKTLCAQLPDFSKPSTTLLIRPRRLNVVRDNDSDHEDDDEDDDDKTICADSPQRPDSPTFWLEELEREYPKERCSRVFDRSFSDECDFESNLAFPTEQYYTIDESEDMVLDDPEPWQNRVAYEVKAFFAEYSDVLTEDDLETMMDADSIDQGPHFMSKCGALTEDAFDEREPDYSDSESDGERSPETVRNFNEMSYKEEMDASSHTSVVTNVASEDKQPLEDSTADPDDDGEAASVALYKSVPFFDPVLLEQFKIKQQPLDYELIIRPCTVGDVSECLKIYQASKIGVLGDLRPEVREQLEGVGTNEVGIEAQFSVLAEVKGTSAIAGFIVAKFVELEHKPPVLHLRTLYVRPYFRRETIGMMLISAVCHAGMKYRMEHMAYGHWPSHGDALKSYLMHLGFKETNEDEFDHQISGTVYSLRLGPRAYMTEQEAAINPARFKDVVPSVRPVHESLDKRKEKDSNCKYKFLGFYGSLSKTAVPCRSGYSHVVVGSSAVIQVDRLLEFPHLVLMSRPVSVGVFDVENDAARCYTNPKCTHPGAEGHIHLPPSSLLFVVTILLTSFVIAQFYQKGMYAYLTNPLKYDIPFYTVQEALDLVEKKRRFFAAFGAQGVLCSPETCSRFEQVTKKNPVRRADDEQGILDLME
ncbi:unnamed protein product [Caenorhabditis auriculariae]|uniref:N-acetyltransferase domain-containing protein n=1 Tax=Caenorhabditis auriculariae TaxID=2777116 RepID=A0A8S1H3M9_9PELO|nr:unnamed protein product [Caenorhabditis auriculariae]